MWQSGCQRFLRESFENSATEVVGHFSPLEVGVSRDVPLGRRLHLTIAGRGEDAAAELARQNGQLDLFEKVRAVSLTDPVPSFLHSALCAMSLPVRKPSDEHAPIIRQDGQYTLAITPKPIVLRTDGKGHTRSLGVPYGPLPRLILIHIMTEAVKLGSRHIVLGSSFTDWMRKMGFQTISYGPRGSATLLRNQLDRLLACEWMIRWEQDTGDEHAFGVREIRLSEEYAGVDRKSGRFHREIIMAESFYSHLRDHAVPLNEHAIRQIRDSATAIDLYTWLAYRLPRVSGPRPLLISWQQLAVHFGNDGTNIRKFRQTIRDAWERYVSGVYPEARVEFDTACVRLSASPPPLHQKAVRGLTVVAETDDVGTPDAVGSTHEITPTSDDETALALMSAMKRELGPTDAKSWLRGGRFEKVDGAWHLIVETQFIASWINAHFDKALHRVARTTAIDEVIKARTAPPLSHKHG